MPGRFLHLGCAFLTCALMGHFSLTECILKQRLCLNLLGLKIDLTSSNTAASVFLHMSVTSLGLMSFPKLNSRCEQAHLPLRAFPCAASLSSQHTCVALADEWGQPRAVQWSCTIPGGWRSADDKQSGVHPRASAKSASLGLSCCCGPPATRVSKFCRLDRLTEWSQACTSVQLMLAGQAAVQYKACKRASFKHQQHTGK